jgi:lysophospholipid acyltransferase (LPLAT)-like uncharacterized protein
VSLKMNLIAIAGSAFIRTLGYTWRIRKVGADLEAQAREHSPQVIYALWHGRLLPLSFAYRNLSIQVLASEHRDGEMLGRTIQKLGFGHVKGSSTRGGTRAIFGMVEKINDGFDLGITVDGPRGPRHRVKPGSIQIAKMSGAAIVPITTSSRRHKTFSSWDTFELPYPFTEVRVCCGEPVIVPPDADVGGMEEKRLELESKLADITKANDDAFSE